MTKSSPTYPMLDLLRAEPTIRYCATNKTCKSFTNKEEKATHTKAIQAYLMPRIILVDALCIPASVFERNCLAFGKLLRPLLVMAS